MSAQPSHCRYCIYCSLTRHLPGTTCVLGPLLGRHHARLEGCGARSGGHPCCPPLLVALSAPSTPHSVGMPSRAHALRPLQLLPRSGPAPPVWGRHRHSHRHYWCQHCQLHTVSTHCRGLRPAPPPPALPQCCGLHSTQQQHRRIATSLGLPSPAYRTLTIRANLHELGGTRTVLSHPSATTVPNVPRVPLNAHSPPPTDVHGQW